MATRKKKTDDEKKAVRAEQNRKANAKKKEAAAVQDAAKAAVRKQRAAMDAATRPPPKEILPGTDPADRLAGFPVGNTVILQTTPVRIDSRPMDFLCYYSMQRPQPRERLFPKVVLSMPAPSGVDMVELAGEDRKRTPVPHFGVLTDGRLMQYMSPYLYGTAVDIPEDLLDGMRSSWVVLVWVEAGATKEQVDLAIRRIEAACKYRPNPSIVQRGKFFVPIRGVSRFRKPVPGF